ncbi:MAG: hypothetical protein HY074_02695, partial [Deltaproteobacteria bacterium]|nr:hypothetical protein [Deltaproteobacteria bacterium]
MSVKDQSIQNPAWTRVDVSPDVLFGKETVLPSSEAQREIFSASLTDPDASRAYNHSISIFFEGTLDVDALYSSLLNLLNRHEALRGTFSDDGGSFKVRAGIAFGMPILDLSELSEIDQKSCYEKFVRQELDHV